MPMANVLATSIVYYFFYCIIYHFIKQSRPKGLILHWINEIIDSWKPLVPGSFEGRPSLICHTNEGYQLYKCLTRKNQQSQSWLINIDALSNIFTLYLKIRVRIFTFEPNSYFFICLLWYKTFNIYKLRYAQTFVNNKICWKINNKKVLQVP